MGILTMLRCQFFFKVSETVLQIYQLPLGRVLVKDEIDQLELVNKDFNQVLYNKYI